MSILIRSSSRPDSVPIPVLEYRYNRTLTPRVSEAGIRPFPFDYDSPIQRAEYPRCARVVKWTPNLKLSRRLREAESKRNLSRSSGPPEVDPSPNPAVRCILNSEMTPYHFYLFAKFSPQKFRHSIYRTHTHIHSHTLPQNLLVHSR